MSVFRQKNILSNELRVVSGERLGTLRAASEENTRVIISRSRISRNIALSFWRDWRDLRE